MTKLYAVLVTYRRPRELSTTLAALAKQTRQPDVLVVVDNGPSEESAAAAAEAAQQFIGKLEYLTMAENLGYTGGVSVGMEGILTRASDDDWIVVCDDDDPPQSTTAFATLLDFGQQMVMKDARTAGVGLGGGRFDFRRGRIVRVATNDLHGAVPVDYIGGGYFGCYRVSAIRSVGPWSADIFFGFSEGEFGLRLKRAGHLLWAEGETWRARRIAAGRADFTMKPARRLPAPGWRRYYSLRNVIWILRQHGHFGAAVRVSLVNGIAKPLANFGLTPIVAIRHLLLNVRAIFDAWTDRMGRRVEPIPWGARPDEHATVPTVLARLRSS